VPAQERESGPDRVDDEDEAQVSHLQKLRAVATMLFQLNRAIAVLHTCLADTLRGKALCRDEGLKALEHHNVLQ
jgi:hypothetical protein